MNNLLKSCAFLLLILLTGCANFQKLSSDLKLLDKKSIVTATISNGGNYKNVRAFVAEWAPDKNKVYSGDYTSINSLGVFGFFVPDDNHQYLLAYSDSNQNDRYDPGKDAAWIHSSESGKPIPIWIDPETRRGSAVGKLSKSTILPSGLVESIREFKGARTADEAARGLKIPITLGTIANLDDPKFSAERGSRGIWEPASFPLQSGIGIYFLERYDPARTPVLFVYGAAGSPQDWRPIFNKLDRKKYQAWFYYYPTGRRLDEMGSALEAGMRLLQSHYQCPRIHIVAHSMGGLVSRLAILESLDEGGNYIDKYVTISTPWDGHEFAEMGVKRAPSVVPSWYDMVPNSEFLDDLFKKSIRGKVDHLLIYGNKASDSMILPDENDGTVSVASETRAEAVKQAVKVSGFHEDHVSILSNDEVFRLMQQHLGR